MAKAEFKYYPTVIVPGIGQSKVDMYDNEGNRKLCAWPLDLDEKALVKEIAAPFAAMMVTRKYDKFCEALKAALKNAIDPLSVNKDGIPKNDLRPVDYRRGPISQCSDEEKRYIYVMVPMQRLAEVIGEDKMFFFAYNSFGQPYETAAQLHSYIQHVKELTGCDKVNLVPVSLGGSIMTAYLDAYGARGDIHRVCYFVPAANGSTMIADVLSGNLDLSDPASLFGLLLGDKTAHTIMSIAAKMPEGALDAIIDSVLDVVKGELIVNCPGMWAVVPREHYKELYDRYLVGPKFGTLRAKADRFYRAQGRLREMIEQQEKMGVKFFVICGYDRQLPAFCGTKTLNADGIVDFKSASLGGTGAELGTTLPEREKVYDRCKNKKHNHISPENTVDLSTAMFPDSTFCFRYQVHDDAGWNDLAIGVAKEVLTNEDFTDVYSDPRYPQFNGSRNTRKLVYDYLPEAEKLLETDLHETPRADLEKAVAAAKALLDKTIVDDFDEAGRVTIALKKALIAARPVIEK